MADVARVADIADMADRDVVRRMEHWGYEFLKKTHAKSPGYSTLAVAIRRHPTRQHYDPEAIHLTVRDDHTAPASKTLQLDAHAWSDSTFCPRIITLSDRYDKRVTFFGYGGDLHVVRMPDETLYLLESPAPIMELTPRVAVDVPSQLAAATQALWARVRVGWRNDDSGYWRWLAQTPPLDLYAATIASLLSTLQRSTSLRQASHPLYRQLQIEKRWLVKIGAWRDRGELVETLESVRLAP